MTVGIALAAGGVIATIGGVCSIAWLEQAFPGTLDPGSDVVLSTASGGTTGYSLYVTDRDNLWFSPYHENVPLHEASGRWAPPGKTWWGKGIAATGSITGNGVTGPRLLPKSELPPSLRWRLPSWDLWVRETSYEYPGSKDLGQSPGFVPWYTNFAVIPESKAPLHPGPKGYQEDILKSGMFMGYREMLSGATYPRDAFSPSASVSTRDHDAVDWSSSFWADPFTSTIDPFTSPIDPFTSPNPKNLMEWQIMKRLLPHDPKHKYYFSDAGLVDSTGIVGLLRAQTDTIIAFYNNMGDFTIKDWPIKFLFGVDIAPGKKSIPVAGPRYQQVFPSYLEAEVFANLTNPKILRATLHNVPVLRNDWYGVRPYILKTLHWTANGRSEEFLDSFRDHRIKQEISPKFPNLFTKSMPTLDANMMCMFQAWRGDKYKTEIGDALHGR